MIQNVLVNTPDDWAVQLLVHPDWWKNEISALHCGMQTLIDTNSRVIVTPIPAKFYKSKPKHVLMDSWFWESLVAERVLFFSSGNGVICAHSVVQWNQLQHLDYLGAPWG